MMKNYSFLIMILAVIFAQADLFGQTYLWEMRTDEGRSCCLHIRDIDICNPYKPCTGFAKLDLSGILDYISRILSTDQAKVEPHATILTQVKQYVRSILNNPYGTIGYKHEYRCVKFYHDIITESVLRGKEKKEPAPAAKAKSAKDDFVAQHLIKLGLMKEWKKK